MSSQRFPRMFGKYALLRPFARGGMGEIYLAASGDVVGAEKLCLVKKVPEDRDAPGLTARLLDEAKVAVRLNHTNLVQVFDAGKVDNELYIAMELIEGRDLRAVWNRTAERRSRIPLDVALYVVREIARGLEYAHGYGGLNLVHRDIAPPNILLSFHGEIKVTDFGLARSILKNEKTAPGIVYGRIAYLAPEQARGEQADARTDIFATGVILWELLTGRPLHDSTDDAVKNLDMARHPRVETPSHLTRGLPSSVDALSLKALAPEREQRYQSAEEFRKAVADELARIAPGTDASRVAAFLKDLFSDEIKREQVERERLLREDLPKLRAERDAAAARTSQPSMPAVAPPPPAPAPPPPSKREASGEIDDGSDPATQIMRQVSLPTPKPEVKAAPPLPGMRPPSVARPVTGKPITVPPTRQAAAVLGALNRALGEVDEDERTVTVPPRGLNRPGAPRPALSPRPAPAPLTEPEPQTLVGATIDGRYRVERLLGTGGMGAVYEAEHIEIGKKVALKVLHPQFSRQEDLVARFRREARAASRVGHPNIVDVTDSGTTEKGDVYFVMERLDGLDLGEVLRHERRIAPDRTVAIGTQICRALSAAHAAGIIHRDLKPENIFLVSREGVPDFVKVLDFGIAKHDMGNQNAPRRLTTPGIAMGTPEYMAPEQAAGKAIDGRVDIYSVGAILYEMLCGDPPHAGDNAMEVLAKKATEAPAPLRRLNPGVPEQLESVVLKCLERDPAQRPQTMGALEYELTKSAKGRGSAVMAVLGLKPSDEVAAQVGWTEESSKPRLFEAGAVQQRRGSMPSIPIEQSGLTGALPLDAADDKIRINTPPPPRVAAREPGVETPTIQKQNRATDPEVPGPRAAAALRRQPTLIVGATFLILAAAFAGYRLWPSKPARDDAQAKKTARDELLPPMKTVNAPTPRGSDDDRMSPAEIDRMLEWARRTAEGGRITSPPGDNLKELLDRIDKASPGNPQAEALKTRTTNLLARKGLLALKKNKLDEAEQDFRALVVLKPDDEWSKLRLARTLTMRSRVALEKRRFQSALADAKAAVELAPDDTATQLALADVHLGMGKNELAAEEYQNVLDIKPADKRAKKGLLVASAPKAAPKGKKKSKR